MNETEQPVAKEYKPHQLRVIDEARQLNVRLNKLTTYLSELTSDMDTYDLDLLRIQRESMTTYLNVLNARIRQF